MFHPREYPLSGLTLTPEEESGEFAPTHRRHTPQSADFAPTPQSVRYVWPSAPSRPIRHFSF